MTHALGCRLSPRSKLQGTCGPDLGSASAGTRHTVFIQPEVFSTHFPQTLTECIAEMSGHASIDGAL